jgi:hypothetical protein
MFFKFTHFFFPFDFGFNLRVAVREVDEGQVTLFLEVFVEAFFGLLVRVFRYTYEDRMRPVVDLAAALVPVAAVRSCFS